MSTRVIICPSCKTGNRPSYKQCTTCGRSFVDDKTHSKRSIFDNLKISKDYKEVKKRLDQTLFEFNALIIIA